MSSTWFIQGNATQIPLPDGSVDLIFGSSPYLDARTYGIGAQRKCAAWIDWMLEVTTEATRVSRGLVLWVVAGVTRKRCYQPGPEGLLYEWWKRGGHCWRPCYWHRVGIPGSGGAHWLRADVEYVLAFKRDAEWPVWSDNTAMGHPPKWAPGGEMSNRLGNGARVNQWGKNGEGKGIGARKMDGTFANYDRPSHVVKTAAEWRGHAFGNQTSTAGRRPDGTPKPVYFNGRGVDRMHRKREPNGAMREQGYTVPVLANPGNLIKTKIGGGKMGHPLAHENEAPFPVELADFFIRSFCPPGGTVFDPFSGSGTTVDAAMRAGRNAIGMDLRMSQCELGRRRLLQPVAVGRKKSKPRIPTGEPTLFSV